ncbi:hypothetical protein [Nocardia sp. NPDC059236]
MKQTELADDLLAGLRTYKRWENGGTIGEGGHAALSARLAKLSPSQAEAFRRFRNGDEPEPAEVQSEPRRLDAGRPDAATIASVRTTLWAAMELDDKLGSPAALGLVTAQKALTAAMLRDCGPELQPALLSLYAEWHGLAGALAADDGDHATAAQCYEDAREYAHDAEDDDLAAYMLCHMSQLAIWQGRRRIAMDHATAARSWVTQSADRRLRAYVGIRFADAAGRIGQRMAALSALDDAAHALDGLTLSCHPSESRAYFVGPGLLESFSGLVHTQLGDPARGAEASRHAVGLIPETFVRDRALTLLELADPLGRMGEIEEAAAVVGHAAEMTAQNRSPRLADSIRSARAQLLPWAATAPVIALDEQLVARDIVSR